MEIAVIRGQTIHKDIIYSMFLTSETQGRIIIKLYCTQENTIGQHCRVHKVTFLYYDTKS